MSNNIYHYFKNKPKYKDKLKHKDKPKYENQKTSDGIRSYASKAEKIISDYLLVLEKLGEINNIRYQKKVYLTDARIGYIPDFLVFDLKLNEDVYIECKGFETERWLIVKKLWRFYGFGLLRIYNVKNNQVFLKEEIRSKHGG